MGRVCFTQLQIRGLLFIVVSIIKFSVIIYNRVITITLKIVIKAGEVEPNWWELVLVLKENLKCRTKPTGEKRSFNNFIGSYWNFYKITFDIDRSRRVGGGVRRVRTNPLWSSIMADWNTNDYNWQHQRGRFLKNRKLNTIILLPGALYSRVCSIIYLFSVKYCINSERKKK